MKMSIFPLAWLLAGAAVLTAGCSQQDKPPHPDDGFFRPQGHFTDAESVMHRQAVAGARNDATLYPRHFSGAELNSLGREKLALMGYEDPERPATITVHLNVPTDGTEAQRRKAVEAFLRDQGGYAANQVKVELGPNPAASTPAAYGMARSPRTESGESGSAEASSPVASGEK